VSKTVIILGAVALIIWLSTKPSHELAHKVAWYLGVADAIIVGWSMFFSGGGH
jgi:hypothetical protein